MLGIGLNVHNDGHASGGSFESTSVVKEMQLSNEVHSVKNHNLVEELLESLTNSVYQSFNRFERTGFASFHAYISQRLHWRGEDVVVDTGTEQFQGLFLGLTDLGFARMKLGDDQEQIVSVGHMRWADRRHFQASEL